MQTDTLTYKWDNVIQQHDWYDSTSVTKTVVIKDNFITDGNIITYSIIGLLIYLLVITYMLIFYKTK